MPSLSGGVPSPAEDLHLRGRAHARRVGLARLRARLNQLYSRMQSGEGEQSRLLGPAGANTLSLQEAEAAYSAALRDIEREQLPGVFSLLGVATARELQAWLDSDEALVEFYIAEGEVCAFVLTQTGIRVHRRLAADREIARLLQRLRFHLRRAGRASEYVELHATQLARAAAGPLGRLYDLLLRPLEQALPFQKVTTVPHGVLHGLPFHALFDGRGYALDRWEFVYAPSATLRYSARRHSQSPGAASASRIAEPPLIIGLPDERLTQIGAEVENLAQAHPDARIFWGGCATLENFEANCYHARLIHLATHAMFRRDNPLFSGLRFADGWLLARDLYGLRLNCDLVTLSACRTGQTQVESGDEMFGLLRGFLAAGARTVAVSLWLAEVRPTAALMSRFHGLLAQGCTLASALRAAQREVREKWPHPYHWAAFALFGER